MKSSPKRKQETVEQLHSRLHEEISWHPAMKTCGHILLTDDNVGLHVGVGATKDQALLMLRHLASDEIYGLIMRAAIAMDDAENLTSEKTKP